MFCIALSPLSVLWRLRDSTELWFILGGLAVWGAFAIGREKWRKYRSKSWPIAVGTIGEIRSRKVDGGLNGIDYWKVSFDYSYQVQAEHKGTYSFNCTSEGMSAGAVAGLRGKTVSVHYPPSNEAKGIVWEDDVWDIWWETYWQMTHDDGTAAAG